MCETEDIFVERQKDVIRNSCLNVTDFELELEELTGQQIGGLEDLPRYGDAHHVSLYLPNKTM